MSDAAAPNPLASSNLVAPGGPSTLHTRPALNDVTDVWSWTARKYRIRATVLLLVNLLLFCGLCIFIHWLHHARLFSFDLASYLTPLRFWGEDTLNLSDFVLFPISVAQTPIYGVVVGLLVATLVAVPISVSIIYRFQNVLPFLAAVFILAHMPWLAITLLASCVLASVPPFRMPFRYGSALLGMLPVLLYLYLATRGESELLGASISPERRLLLTGPWLLAILAACTMLAVIIFIARMVRYRPGAVAPVMVVMFAMPAMLFHTQVGVDELRYRLLEAEYGPRSERFEPVRDAVHEIRSLLHFATHPQAPRDSFRAALLTVWSARPEEVTTIKKRICRPLLLELLDDRREAYDACKSFIADHPNSRYIPNVLFIQARALDTRLDERKLMGPAAQRELYTDFPHVQSEPVWMSLVAQYPDSPLAAAGRLHLAQLRLRKGDADGALAALAPRRRTAPPAPPYQQRPGMQRLLYAQPPEESLDFEPEPYLFEAQRLRELIAANRDDPRYGVQPLRRLASLDPHREQYKDQLQRLAHDYSDGLLHDNIVVRWANAHRDRHQRANLLRACLRRFPAGDAASEAMFQLAELEVHVFGINDAEARQRGIQRLRDLVEQRPRTCWAAAAAERLQLLEPRFPHQSGPESES